MPVRGVRLPGDEGIILSFLHGLQDHEAGFEPDRRRDPAWTKAHWREILRRRRERHGAMFLAEDETGRAVGWAFAHDAENELYVVEDERRHGYLAELYVTAQARGAGHGRALIAACEAWARGRGHRLLMIGVLAGNAGAVAAYERVGYAPYALTMRRYL